MLNGANRRYGPPNYDSISRRRHETPFLRLSMDEEVCKPVLVAVPADVVSPLVDVINVVVAVVPLEVGRLVVAHGLEEVIVGLLVSSALALTSMLSMSTDTPSNSVPVSSSVNRAKRRVSGASSMLIL